jgi:hypothetical protein
MIILHAPLYTFMHIPLIISSVDRSSRLLLWVTSDCFFSRSQQFWQHSCENVLNTLHVL